MSYVVDKLFINSSNWLKLLQLNIIVYSQHEQTTFNSQKL